MIKPNTYVIVKRPPFGVSFLLENTMTTEEDKFIKMDEGELISECLQIAACLGGKMQRLVTSNSQGRTSKKIVIEYDVRERENI